MTDYKTLITKVIEYQNKYDSDKMLEYFTDDAKFVMMDDNSTYLEGKENLKNMIDETKVEDRYTWTLDNIFTTGDRVVTSETLEKPNHERENYIFIYEIQDDHIKKVWMTSQKTE